MIIADRIAKDIIKNSYFQSLFKICLEHSYYQILSAKVSSDFNEKEYRDLLRFADLLSTATLPEARTFAYQIITYLNFRYKYDPYYCMVSKSVYYNLGNFPAVGYLTMVDKNHAELPLDKKVQIEAKKTIQEVPNVEDLYFTDTQYALYTSLSESREFSFSGPTSMGKSFIIKAFIRRIIYNKPPENMVIIVPTRALITQFAVEIKQELGKQLEENRYKIVTNSNVSEFVLENNTSLILILTPERLISYLSQQENPAIGFLFVDEAQKIAQSDTRSITTYVAIEKTLKKYPTVKIYFSSPNISNPEIFLKLFRKTEQNSFKTEETTVAQNLFFADLRNGELSYYYNDGFTQMPIKIPQNIRNVNDFLKFYGKDSNLVYCNSVSHTISYAKNLAESITKDDVKVVDNSLLTKVAKIISKYIHPDYYLADIIKKGVAYHFGNMPQVIRNLIESLYKDGKIKYIFCTSTLLEGINMPTQNLFILDNKKHKSVLKPIDFWNLAGRAGRMSKELQGNIFCVKHMECNWNDTSFFNEKRIELVPTIYDRINHNLRKIEKQIEKNEISSGSEEEKNILRYIANIICIDTLEPQSGYKSPIIDELIRRNKETIIKLAENKSKDIKIPFFLLDSNDSIDIHVQNSVYLKLKKLYKEKQSIKLPSHIDYTRCLEVLEMFYDLYDWSKTNSELHNKNSLKYYSFLMNKWINGISLNQIISDSIDYNASKQSLIHIIPGHPELFDRNKKEHVNKLIGDIIRDIEKIMRFQLEKYFNHYFNLLIHILGEDNAGENWATLLEYGTQNRIIIALQNLGLSRYTAHLIYKNYRSSLVIENGKLKGINKLQLLGFLNRGTIEYDEVNDLL